jgi:hypothetical protein
LFSLGEEEDEKRREEKRREELFTSRPPSSPLFPSSVMSTARTMRACFYALPRRAAPATKANKAVKTGAVTEDASKQGKAIDVFLVPQMARPLPELSRKVRVEREGERRRERERERGGEEKKRGDEERGKDSLWFYSIGES